MISPRIARELREAGYDVQAIKRDRTDLFGSSDLKLVRRMATEPRTIVTNDVDDFTTIHERLLAAGQEHHGISSQTTRPCHAPKPRSPSGCKHSANCSPRTPPRTRCAIGSTICRKVSSGAGSGRSSRPKPGDTGLRPESPFRPAKPRSGGTKSLGREGARPRLANYPLSRVLRLFAPLGVAARLGRSPVKATARTRPAIAARAGLGGGVARSRACV